MQVPLELTFRHAEHSPALEGLVRHHTERLQHFADDIISCRVAVEKRHRHQHTHNPFHVRVEVKLPPQHDLVVVKEPRRQPHGFEGKENPALERVIREAFQTMERKLKETRKRRRGDVKVHEVNSPEGSVGLVIRLFPHSDGQDIYFHRHSVLHGDFDRLTIGTAVRFVPEMGNQGLQASTVQIIDKPGVRRSGNGPADELVPEGWKP